MILVILFIIYKKKHYGNYCSMFSTDRVDRYYVSILFDLQGEIKKGTEVPLYYLMSVDSIRV